MNKKNVFLPVLLIIAAFTFAQEETASPSILDNEYYQESVRLNEMAKAAFEEGDYDTAALYAGQAAEYAAKSDEYAAMCLAEDTLARAHDRYVWAGSVNAASRYPSQYREATAAYNEAVKASQNDSWEDVSDAANRVLAALVNVRGAGGESGPRSGIIVAAKPPSAVPGALPSQYTVRLWAETGDCFSTIAGRPGVYGDPYQWRKLYEANKNKLPNPNNPNLILPGMVMDIPALSGETRSGMWDPQTKY